MAQPSDADPTAGLYAYSDDFNPSANNARLSPDDAYDLLQNGQGIYFHPPNGDWEQIENTQDLQVYVFSQENRSDAPPQDAAPAS